MEIEQPELGMIGVDTFTVMAAWSWETGWRIRFARRLSGSQSWAEFSWDGRDEAELMALLTDHLAEALGLI